MRPAGVVRGSAGIKHNTALPSSVRPTVGRGRGAGRAVVGGRGCHRAAVELGEDVSVPPSPPPAHLLPAPPTGHPMGSRGTGQGTQSMEVSVPGHRQGGCGGVGRGPLTQPGGPPGREPAVRPRAAAVTGHRGQRRPERLAVSLAEAARGAGEHPSTVWFVELQGGNKMWSFFFMFSIQCV